MERVTIETYERRIHPCYDRYHSSTALLAAAAGGNLECESTSALRAIDDWVRGERPMDYRRVMQNLHWSQLQTLADWYYSPDMYCFELYLIDYAGHISIWCSKNSGAIICDAPDGSRFEAVFPA